MRTPTFFALLIAASITGMNWAIAGVGDPQLGTDHVWYPGELATSTFERLFTAQATAFEHVTGRPPVSDEDFALAAWMWRNTHYAHGEEGKQNLWGGGFTSGDTTTRDYWTGMYAHGFGLCGTTHAQWTAELNALLGPQRSRTVGVAGHNACEVLLTGGAYGDGQWALLDHDLSTVIFDPAGKRLLSIDEVRQDLKRLIDPNFKPERQRGWPLGGLHPDDPKAYSAFRVVEHLPGYAGPPPMVHLRKGESLKRYYRPGLDDGETFVFWGRNYNQRGIPGPERNRTWINQPDNFRDFPNGSGYKPGQFRYGNAVYTYQPDFENGGYREGVIEEADRHLIFEFQSPYIIAATPPDDSDWGIYKENCRNGLIISYSSSKEIPVSVSVDRGTTWQAASFSKQEGGFHADLTDAVKGYRQYWLKLAANPTDLQGTDLKVVTVCQANPATFPKLSENGSRISYAASSKALVSAGPTKPHAAANIIAGGFDTPRVTLAIEPPRGQLATHIHAVAHVASSNPPNPEFKYQIDYSTDDGASWQPLVKDWRIERSHTEPKDFWSQSFCYGSLKLPKPTSRPVQIRFRNDGGKRYLRAEAHLASQVENTSPLTVTFCWSDDAGENRTHRYHIDRKSNDKWEIDTKANVEMQWVEMRAE